MALSLDYTVITLANLPYIHSEFIVGLTHELGFPSFGISNLVHSRNLEFKSSALPSLVMARDHRSNPNCYV